MKSIWSNPFRPSETESSEVNFWFWWSVTVIVIFLLSMAIVNAASCVYVYDMEAGKWVQQCNEHCNKPPKCEHVYDVIEGEWKTVCVDQCE